MCYLFSSLEYRYCSLYIVYVVLLLVFVCSSVALH